MKLFSILESNVQEALELGVAKDYAEHIRRPETEKVIDDLMAKLKQQSTFTGKESKRGERIYFNYESGKDSTENFTSRVMDMLELTLYNNSDLFKELFGKTYKIENGKDYLDGLATDSRGQKVGIGKLFNMTAEKLKKRGGDDPEHLVQRFEYNRRYFQEDEERNSAISGKNKKRYIVISKANYDIAGMTTGRSWNSCMSLTSGNGQKYVHCDIKEGSLIAYLVNEDDTNIQRPVARLLIKPFISTSNYKDYLYVAGDTYGTAPGFSDVVKKMFKEAQPDKSGTYRINRKLYPDTLDTQVTMTKKVKVVDREMMDKLISGISNSYRQVSIDGRSFKEYLEIDPGAIEKISGVDSESTVYISSDKGYLRNEDLSLDKLSEVSDIKSDDSFHAKDIPNLKKISNIDSPYIFIRDCPNIESAENISCEKSFSIDSPKIRLVTGKVQSFYIGDIDQETADSLDMGDLKVTGFFQIENFSGTSLNKLLSNINVDGTIYLENSDTLEEIPNRMGDGYSRLSLPKNLEGKIKEPEGINYSLSFTTR